MKIKKENILLKFFVDEKKKVESQTFFFCLVQINQSIHTNFKFKKTYN